MLLTTPYLYYQAISEADKGPFVEEENGEHVRRGYNTEMLKELCNTLSYLRNLKTPTVVILLGFFLFSFVMNFVMNK